jgi:hypothetical protein
VDRVVVQPLNPEAAQSVSSDGLNLLPRPIEYFSIGENPPTDLALTNGSYEMDRIILANIQLVDTVVPRETPLQFFKAVPISAEDYGSDVFISVETGATNQFNVVIDATELAIAFQAAASVANPNTQPEQFAAELAALSSQYLILE